MTEWKIALIGDELDESRWRKIARHTETEIYGFFGKYRFLSNFWPATVLYEDVIYPSVENAYQAAKFLESEREAFLHCSPGMAKKLGKEELNRKYTDAVWREKKISIMDELVYSKFLRQEVERSWLLETSIRELIEANWWEDIFWGVYVSPVGVAYGENNLGKSLMRQRSRFLSSLSVR